MSNDLIRQFLSSINPETTQEATLTKSAEEFTKSVESLLKSVDSAIDLHKAAPENATIGAEFEKAESKETVTSTEKVIEDDKTKKKAAATAAPENASPGAEFESAESTDTVTSTEKKLGEDAPPSKNAEVALHKSEEKEEKEEKEEEKEEKEDEKKAGDKLMKKAGLDQSDLDVFDVTEPLKNLKKSYDVLAEEVSSLRKSNEAMVGMFRELVTSHVKGYALQKSMSETMEKVASTPNAPKGRINVLQKNFTPGNETPAADKPNAQEFVGVLLKAMDAGKIDVMKAGNYIAAVETCGQMSDQAIQDFNTLKNLK